MQDYPKVAIPSYQRADIITYTTLAFLHREGYPVSKIHIFVASEAERTEYVEKIPRHLYSQIILGVLGLKEQRAFISNFFPENEILVQLDDDVRGIKFKEPETFLELVQKGCEYLSGGLPQGGLFGVLPNDDGRKMQARTTYHLTHILGSFFICRNRRDLLPTTTHKEDFERSILYFQRYGAVARYKGAGVITKYAETPGGLQQEGRRQQMLEEINYLLHTYPRCVKYVLKAKGPDMILDWRFKPS